MTQRVDVLQVGDVAVLFRVDPKTVSRWVAAGKLRGFRTRGGHWRFHKVDVDALLNSQTTQATPPDPAGNAPAV